MDKIRTYQLVTGLSFIVLVLVTCSGVETDLPPTPTPVRDELPTITKTPSPTLEPIQQTFEANKTLNAINAMTRAAQSTQSAGERTLTALVPSTDTPTATQTPVVFPSNPTAVAIPEDDTYQSGLREQGYDLVFSSSTVGPGGYIYSVYLYADSTFQIKFPYADREISPTEGCKIVFYRSDGETNVLVESFAPPKYPEGSIYSNYPVGCRPNHWNEVEDFWLFSIYWWFPPPTDEVFEKLNLQGVWSDINQNGLPEFAMYFQYCPNACLNHGAVATHFYEIQTTSEVVHITADLPGVIEPFYLVHSNDPLDFYVYDPTLWYCYKWCIIETWWIYGWDGEKLVDVTSRYKDEYITRGESIKASIQDKYGESFRDSELLTILFLYEKAGLRSLAIESFLELSDPSNWPNASLEELCWLQSARATALEDYEKGQPFRFPEFQLEGAQLPVLFQLPQVILKIDHNKYDISACLDIIATPTPEP
jgi:hypothetical protein